mmetsp:Transcript_12378/g.49616  ORF Transcript_12378/g.49616 Transcript_12378/m.49616 type:complete len:160 (+) Transcript_12378:439-918(+)
MVELARCYTALGKHDAAAALQEEATQRLHGDTSVVSADRRLPAGVVPAMKSQAAAYAAAGNVKEAARLQEQILRYLRRTMPPGDTRLSDVLDDLALSYISLNRRREAVPLLEEALELTQRAHPTQRRCCGHGEPGQQLLGARHSQTRGRPSAGGGAGAH